MRVVVAMSGGVDSSVAAVMLKREGHEVIGVHMRLHDEVTEVVPRSCCGQADALDAREVCEAEGIPFYVTDYRKQFESAVIKNFVDEFKAGRTPIPCVHCNGVMKFRLLLAQAEAIGCDFIATGHYAQRPGEFGISKAADTTQDQSYFLFSVPRANTPKLVFPLGQLYKTQVRDIAHRYGIITADKPDSQDICFVPKRNHREFLATKTTDDYSAEVLDDGRSIGRIDSYLGLTVGQRRGLSIGSSGARYVQSIDPVNRTVTVTANIDNLKRDRFRVSKFNWIFELGRELTVHTRYRTPGVQVTELTGVGSSDVEVRTYVPVVAVPGQAAVFYYRDHLVGGGWIERD